VRRFSETHDKSRIRTAFLHRSWNSIFHVQPGAKDIDWAPIPIISGVVDELVIK
jgi:hypothetical protein